MKLLFTEDVIAAQSCTWQQT